MNSKAFLTFFVYVAWQWTRYGVAANGNCFKAFPMQNFIIPWTLLFIKRNSLTLPQKSSVSTLFCISFIFSLNFYVQSEKFDCKMSVRLNPFPMERYHGVSACIQTRKKKLVLKSWCESKSNHRSISDWETAKRFISVSLFAHYLCKFVSISSEQPS